MATWAPGGVADELEGLLTNSSSRIKRLRHEGQWWHLLRASRCVLGDLDIFYSCGYCARFLGRGMQTSLRKSRTDCDDEGGAPVRYALSISFLKVDVSCAVVTCSKKVQHLCRGCDAGHREDLVLQCGLGNIKPGSHICIAWWPYKSIF